MRSANQRKRRTENQTGFTLIELLIVIAIILILIAIALPNFLEAQIRAKVARVQAEEQSLATALEAYQTDFRKYPYDGSNGSASVGSPYPVGNFALKWGNRKSPGEQLTTPIAYITAIPIDIFNTSGFSAGYTWQPNEEVGVSVFYLNREYNSLPGHMEVWFHDPNLPFYERRRASAWMLYSIGPSLNYGWLADVNTCYVIPYSPTNGTKSQGGIWRLP